MDELTEIRTQIDEIDTQMANLFEQRMAAAARVARYKKQNNKPVLDKSREDIVIQNNLKKLNNPELNDLFEDFLIHNMSLSRIYQSRILSQNIIAYQGVSGAYSHIALKKLFPFAEEIQCESFADVFSAVENDNAHFGVLPIENSFAGDVCEVLDLCYAQNLNIVDMYDLPVRHNLLGVNGASISDIKEIYSHSQAITQCALYIKSLKASTFAYPNTALAAKYVSEAKDINRAAIASKETAELYGLNILAENINTSSVNTTRFIVISKQKATQGNRFSLFFTVEHTAGSLAEVVKTVGALNYNMECIKSRPLPNQPWQYYFYTEIVGDYDGANNLVEHLSKICQTVRLIGVYNK